MRFTLNDEQRQFAASLHDLLSRASIEKVWRELAELGVTALAVPERWGGLGAGPVDLVVAFEELGHHAVPGPVVESVAAVPTLLTELADEQLCQRWLPGLANGDLIATLTAPPHLPHAADADAAELVLAVDGDTLRLAVPTGVTLSTVDPTRRLFPTTPGTELASGVQHAAERAFELGTLATAAELLGAGRAMLELTTDYARQRTQFGRPIGQFQAVKHQLADALVALELARPLVFGAAITLRTRDISAAKVAATTAADRVATAALQVHGAIGYTQQYDLSRWLTRVRALRSAWGTLAVHRARVMIN